MTGNSNSVKMGDDSAAPYKLLINGDWVSGEGKVITVLDKYKLTSYVEVNEASEQQAKAALDSSYEAYRRGGPNGYQRGQILDKAAVLLEERIDGFAETMQAEAGFTESDAKGEVRRCIQTLKLSAEEARRLCGEMLPFDGIENQSHRLAFTMRVPLGVVVAITPFNSPLNTVAHKVAPAFAAGNTVILKPASLTPLTACMFAKVLCDAGMPEGFLSVVLGGANVAKYLLADQRVTFYAFTGSTEVGRSIQQAAGLRRTQMELGSMAFTILSDDADLDKALPKVANAAYRKAGQVCTSIQFLLVQNKIFDQVKDRLTEMVKNLKYGSPYEEGTVVGPLISEGEATRIEQWVKDAVDKGATLLAGGSREGAVVAPTLLTDVTEDMQVGCSEIFGPVMSLVPFETMDEAIDRVNSTPYGLATGVFTNRMADAIKTAKKLEVGGVHINETSSSRVDMMPYGGSKESGFGREGPHYTVHEMTEERVVTIAT